MVQELSFLLIIFSSMQTLFHQLEEFVKSLNFLLMHSCCLCQKFFMLFLDKCMQIILSFSTFCVGHRGTAHFRVRLFSPFFEVELEMGSSSVSNTNAGLVLAFDPYSSSNAFLCTNFFAAEPEGASITSFHLFLRELYLYIAWFPVTFDLKTSSSFWAMSSHKIVWFLVFKNAEDL